MGELNKKKKHNHTLTDLLKVSIFSAVMLAPFMAIGVRCGYVMWNKNAKDSYSDTYIEKYSLVNSNTMLVENNKYQVLYNANQLGNYSPYIIVRNTNLGDYLNLDSSLTIRQISFVNEANYSRLNLTFTNNDTMRVDNWENYTKSFYITYASSNLNTANTLNRCNLYLITYDNQPLDNAFSYSVSQISNDPVFNWTRNTGIYQPINAMVTGLEIENDTLQILLAYWSLMTAVYIVFDLIIFCFTKLTHFVND